jgi:Short C-terminal domain
MPGLLRGMARTAVVAGTATAVSNRVSRRQADRWSQQDAYAQEAYPQQAYPQQAAAPAEPDYAVELERLAALRDQGVITAEDFEAKKKQVLGI